MKKQEVWYNVYVFLIILLAAKHILNAITLMSGSFHKTFYEKKKLLIAGFKSLLFW